MGDLMRVLGRKKDGSPRRFRLFLKFKKESHSKFYCGIFMCKKAPSRSAGGRCYASSRGFNSITRSQFIASAIFRMSFSLKLSFFREMHNDCRDRPIISASFAWLISRSTILFFTSFRNISTASFPLST